MFGMEANIFAGRKVLLSAATRGLGPALAKELISRGAEVIGIDDCAHSLETLQFSFGGAFVGLASASCEESAVAGIARWIADEHGALFAFICNTALPWPASAASRLATTRSVVQSRLLATHVAPLLAARTGSQLIVLELEDSGLRTLDLAELAECPENTPHVMRATIRRERLWDPSGADRAAGEILSAANEGKSSLRLSEQHLAKIGSQMAQRLCAPLLKARRAVTP
jgi:hypothetical protein